MNEYFNDPSFHVYIANCGKCGNRHLKRDMTAIYIKPGGRNGKMKIMCHLCRECLSDALDSLGVAEPKV